MKHDKRTITAMVTGMVIGAALVSEAAAGIVAEPTWQKIYVDGRQVSMTAYNIAGNNYVRLRDIGQQVGFNVLCVADRRWHTMHDYMKALYHRFETPSRRAEHLDRKIKRTHSQLANSNQTARPFRRNGALIPMQTA